MKKQKSLFLAKRYLRASQMLKDQFPECDLIEKYSNNLAILHSLEETKTRHDFYSELNNELKNEIDEIEIKTKEINLLLENLENLPNRDIIFNKISSSLDKYSLFKKIFIITAVTFAAVLLFTFALKSHKSHKSLSWKAYYYTNPNLDGLPLRIEYESTPNHTWESSSPFPEMPANNFSVKWETNLIASKELDLLVNITADDGVRVYLNSEIIIDAWKKQYKENYSAIKRLSAGNHLIKVEYFEAGGGAMIRTVLNASDPDTKEEIPLMFLKPE